METFGLVALALAVGLGIGAAVAVGSRRPLGPHADTTRIEARLEVQAAELRRLADGATVQDGGTERVRAELAGARRALELLAFKEEERRDRERESWEVVRRLSTVLAGGGSKGRAGENVLRDRLAQLPPTMLVTDLRVNGKVVEFALELPDGRRLPVDSKWTAVAELEALEGAEDPSEMELRAREVERQVAARAREVAQYVDPAVTSPIAVAAVPDAAYAVLKRAHAEAFARGVVIVPYSTALPVLLFLYSLVHRFGDAGDARAALEEVSRSRRGRGDAGKQDREGGDDGGERGRRAPLVSRQGQGFRRAGPGIHAFRRARSCRWGVEGGSFVDAGRRASMIARTWRGWTTSDDVEPYVAYLRETGVKELRETPGNRGVFVFTRVDGDRAEFQVISLWDSLDAVRAFAGDDEHVAVFYPDDDRFLVDRERHADHYDVAVEEPARA